jgi:hypothetical protein
MDSATTKEWTVVTNKTQEYMIASILIALLATLSVLCLAMK